jgi:hypothetical protein
VLARRKFDHASSQNAKVDHAAETPPTGNQQGIFPKIAAFV